jgi:hypothetical protein
MLQSILQKVYQKTSFPLVSLSAIYRSKVKPGTKTPSSRITSQKLQGSSPEPPNLAPAKVKTSPCDCYPTGCTRGSLSLERNKSIPYSLLSVPFLKSITATNHIILVNFQRYPLPFQHLRHKTCSIRTCKGI